MNYPRSAYGDADNESLPKIHENAYLYPGLYKTKQEVNPA